MNVHVMGVGDYAIEGMAPLGDPCPPVEKGPEKQIRRSLKDKEKRLYAPMSDIGDLLSDNKDSLYIRIPQKKVAFTKAEDLQVVDNEDEEDGEGDGRLPPLAVLLLRSSCLGWNI
jgi:ribosome biogenesis protein BMS1